MPKIPPSACHFPLLRSLGAELDSLTVRHNKAAPRNGEVPIGGGEWMDSFFKMEGLRGVIKALRAGKDVAEAVEEGKAMSAAAVKIWNARREWQVHRWEETAWTWLEGVVRRYGSSQTNELL